MRELVRRERAGICEKADIGRHCDMVVVILFDFLYNKDVDCAWGA